MSNKVWTIQQIREYCIGYLEAHADPNPRLSAEWLISAATNLSRVELYAYFDRPVSNEERTKIREGLKRRGVGEPLQYVTGEIGFRHIVLQVSKGVLIPRPETEILVQTLLDAVSLNENSKVLEVGCGTGCIALSIAKESGANVISSDVSSEAIACAKRNAHALNLENKVCFIETDCVAGVHGSFDALISNPPYIPSDILSDLPGEVINFEPALALDGGHDGLDFFRRLLNEALPKLNAGAPFVCELHETCLEKAAIFARDAGLKDVQIIDDLAGKPRVLLGRKQ